MKIRKELWLGDREYRNTGITRDEVSIKIWELISEYFRNNIKETKEFNKNPRGKK